MSLRSGNPETDLYFATVNYHEKVNALARLGRVKPDPFGYGYEEFRRKEKEYNEAKERLRQASAAAYEFLNQPKSAAMKEGAK